MSEKQPQPIHQSQVAQDFDALTEDYEDKINDVLAFGGLEHQFYIDVKRDRLLELLQQRHGDTTKLTTLDLGCGIGAYHSGLNGKFAELHGIDVSGESVAAAARLHPEVVYASYDGDRLPYPDGQFDAVFTICVMHHVPPAGWETFVAEIYRTLRPGGTILVFEHNPYNPATQYIVRTCVIDKDAVLLKPFHLRRMFRDQGFVDVTTRTILSVPPIGALLTTFDRAMGWLPFGAQYYLSATKP